MRSAGTLQLRLAWVVMSVLFPHRWLRLCDDGARPVLEQALPPYHANHLQQTQSVITECPCSDMCSELWLMSHVHRPVAIAHAQHSRGTALVQM